MRQVNTGDTVLVHFVGMLADGSEFDSTAERGATKVKVGGGQLVSGFEDALLGMAEGDTKNVTLEPQDAYGQSNPDFVRAFERKQFPAGLDLQVGAVLQVSGTDGNVIRALVVELDDDRVTLDTNHPLAGKALTFVLKLVEFV